MKIIQYFLRKNRCFIQNKKRTPSGIQIHSIGTGQGTAQSVADHWNSSTVKECVTYICDSDTPGKVLQCLPEDVYSWADAGFGNRNLITIEMCESDAIKYTSGANYVVTNAATFEADIRKSYQTCVELCADICKRYGWNPKSKLANGLYLISSHNEGRLAGVSSAHVDPTHIWPRFGLSMDGFRSDVARYMNSGITPSKAAQTSPEEAWIAQIAPIAQSLYKETKILPSVVIAQTCLETGWGTTDLARKCNIIGAKADLINSTWSNYSVWDGTTYIKMTPEYRNGTLIYISDVFRVYKSFEQCLKDYEMFLLHVSNSKGLKYARIAGMTDPAQVIHAIRIGTGTDSKPEGYCTDPNYETKIIHIINKYNLTHYDGNYMPVPEPAPEPTPVASTIYRVQVGAYKKKENSSNRMKVVRDATGYGCFTVKESDGMYHVYCGSYTIEGNAKKRAKELKQKDITCVVKQYSSEEV